MIAGVAHPTAGDIRVAGYEVGPESKALVSYLPERPYFYRSLRVRVMIAFFADFYEARRFRGRPVRCAFQGHR